jgi:sulfur carrier protein
MQILLNGELLGIADGLSIALLVEQLGLSGKRIAIEMNENIVPRSTYTSTFLNDGDRVEIVHAIGGG